MKEKKNLNLKHFLALLLMAEWVKSIYTVEIFYILIQVDTLELINIKLHSKSLTKPQDTLQVIEKNICTYLGVKILNYQTYERLKF